MHLAAWIVATFCLTRSCVGSQTEPILTLQLWPAGILQADNAYTPQHLTHSPLNTYACMLSTLQSAEQRVKLEGCTSLPSRRGLMFLISWCPKQGSSCVMPRTCSRVDGADVRCSMLATSPRLSCM